MNTNRTSIHETAYFTTCNLNGGIIRKPLIFSCDFLKLFYIVILFISSSWIKCFTTQCSDALIQYITSVNIILYILFFHIKHLWWITFENISFVTRCWCLLKLVFLDLIPFVRLCHFIETLPFMSIITWP